MKTIKRFGILSVGKMLGILYFVLGVIVAVIYGGMGLMMLVFGEAPVAALMMLVFVLFAPLFYGVMGFIMGLIMAWIYNLVADKIGGIEVEIK